MAVDRLKFKDILSSQLPSYVRDDFPLLVDFLTEYYSSQEVKGATLDLIQNLEEHQRLAKTNEDNVDQLDNQTMEVPNMYNPIPDHKF